MNKFAKVLAVTAACAALTGSVAAISGCSESPDLTISGSSSITPLMEVLAGVYEVLNPDISIRINQSDSGTGVSDANNGNSDLGMASRAKKNEDPNVVFHQIAIDGVALIANENCTLDGVTSDEITALYSSGTAIQNVITAAISREGGSGTRDAFDSKFGLDDLENLASCVEEQSSTGLVITAIQGNTSGNTIGYISLGSLTAAQAQQCKPINLNGIAPTVETVIDGSYFLQRPFNIVYKDYDALSDVAKDFIDFIMGDIGQAVIVHEGYISMAQYNDYWDNQQPAE